LIRFILNNKPVVAEGPPGLLLLDLIRYKEHLTGTKVGCREGDCGACTVLIGEWKEGRMRYLTATSCLTALGNIHHRHVVTVEGLNLQGLNPLQQAICEEGGTQCGFCTPGFIVSMAGFCLSGQAPTQANARAAVDGNICRCTGYKSIERALDKVVELLNEAPAVDVMDKGILPAYFKDIPRQMKALLLEPNGVLHGENGRAIRGTRDVSRKFLGGGTDLYVQQHEVMEEESGIEFLSAGKEWKGVIRQGDHCIIGGAATVTDLMESPVIRKAFPHFGDYARLISSTPIRNIATVAGNFVNASPIGDLTIFFLALDAQLTLSDGDTSRELPLRKFYKGYKQLDKRPEEFIERIIFRLPGVDDVFHFEKVSKRTCLDIASVNTAMMVRMSGSAIGEARISAGGVGPVPAILEAASRLITGRTPDSGLVREVIAQAQEEISPIGDARGTEAYKRLLLGQLIKAHFLTLFPQLPVADIMEI